MILAHLGFDNNGNVLEQTLESHLIATGNMAGNIGQNVGMEAFMKLAGYLHDLGKADRLFQDYIRNKAKQQVNHSSAGGRILDDLICADQELTNLKHSKAKFAYFQELLTYILLAHHGLYDLIPYGNTEYKTYQRLRYDEDGDYHYAEDVIPFFQKMNQELIGLENKSFISLIKEAYQEFETIYLKLKSLSGKNSEKEQRKQEKEYYIACLTRLCLSILKEADIYDSANAFHNPKQHLWSNDEVMNVWSDALERVEQMYQKFENGSSISELNKTRNDLARLAKEAAIQNENGIYKLELPTGAGKTKTSLRYGLTNAKHFKRKRLFYITAYLSVLEQNAEDIRDMLKMDDTILEHHSNVVDDANNDFEGNDDYEDYENQTYLKESWESPIVLTTMVQFCNTMFKERASNLRRFCKLINSVIIIDEVQSLPLKVLSNFNLMMNFMKEIMHCNIVHCTATQPVLDSMVMPHPVHYGNEVDVNDTIVNSGIAAMKCFDRVDFYNLAGKNAEKVLSTEELASYILEELDVFDSCLIVLNTKSAVLKLYDYLEVAASYVENIYLTTNLCAAHRLDIISELKGKLTQNRDKNTHYKIICISTQLIEAGVDVDFDIVFRSLAGIDSLVQCAGRCNREGKLQIDGRKIHGKLYIMRFIEENLSNLPDIKSAVEASEYAIRTVCKEEIGDNNRIIVQNLQHPYFEKYYVSNRGKLNYSDFKRSSNMVEELGRNGPGRSLYNPGDHAEIKPLMYQAFRTAAENFQLIDQGTTGVIVPYHNQELLEELELAMNQKDYSGVKKLLQKLQRYTINVYLSPKLEPYIYQNKDYGVYFLIEEYYNGRKGIITEELADWIL
ncbi:MAG: CRISPR-associated helicase Cas3' [Lachnospiraceae bacterium]|nr:CRISPR-associated helicase Cas3' [Lachnospiraceae bacterium]